MDRAYRASKRSGGELEATPKKRKRSLSVPSTPGQTGEPAAPPAEQLSPPRKQPLFANAVQLSRYLKVRSQSSGAAARGSGGKLALRAVLARAARR